MTAATRMRTCGRTRRRSIAPSIGSSPGSTCSRARLIDGLQAFRGLTIRGITCDNAMHRRVPTVSFTIDGQHPQAIAKALRGRQHLRLVRAQLRGRAGAAHGPDGIGRRAARRARALQHRGRGRPAALVPHPQDQERIDQWPFKLAIIGLGKIAQDQHLPGRGEERRLRARRGRVLARRPSGLSPAFQTPAELFASGMPLDAVSLCMPPGPRFDIARDALDAGLHVLMEKPPTPTMGELRRCCATMRPRGAASSSPPGTRSTTPAVDEAKRLLAGRTVTRLHVDWKEDVRHWHPGQEWIWEPGGFGVFDPGINALLDRHQDPAGAGLRAEAALEIPANRATPIAARIASSRHGRAGPT